MKHPIVRKLIRSACRVLAVVAVSVVVLWILVAQPTIQSNKTSAVVVDPVRLRAHVEAMSVEFYPRDWQNTNNLEECADYIAGHFESAGCAVESQFFEVDGRRYRNVIGRPGSVDGPRLVVGAHYDAYGDTPGADDNASGVAVLIELAYLLGQWSAGTNIELVAYVLEEPPFFPTASMGSAFHARNLVQRNIPVKGVIVLEMVGYFSDEPGSQSYPALIFYITYPSRGNFIAVAGRWDQGDWVKAVKAGMKGSTDLPVYSIRAPMIVPGIDLSDHRSYWAHGINALMITDTAFYRNRAYHSASDTAERLDYERMAEVVVSLFEAVKKCQM